MKLYVCFLGRCKSFLIKFAEFSHELCFCYGYFKILK
uniref:Uncharacterized protein n=1 Tax=Anguilla anguilla TaxID=7936 RepID=A0A0E9WDT5_ANGAN